MEWFGIAIGAILAIVLVVLVIKFIRFLFTNFVISRVFSIGCAIAALISAFVIVGKGENMGTAISVIIWTTIFSYLFFIGPTVFDVEWDGTFDFDLDTGRFSPGTVGGFFASFFVAGIISLFLYTIAYDWPAMYFMPSLALLIGNGIFIFWGLKR